MDYNQLIQEYLDGSLNPESESQLFMALSSNEGLRNELKQSIAMDKAMSRRVSAFVPSSSSTVNIFTQLGIGAAVGATTTVAAGGLKQALMTFFTTYSGAVLTGIITFALTTAGFLTLYHPAENSSSSGKIEKSELYNNNLQPANSFPSIATSEQSKHDTVIRYITSGVEPKNPELAAEHVEPTIETVNSSLTESETSMLSVSRPSVESGFKSNLISANHNFNGQYDYYPIDLPNNIDLGLKVELKGNGYWSVVRPEVPQYSSSILSNMQLSALYRLSDKFSLGFDIRQESFYQKFDGVNELGEQYLYKQYPSYISLGLIGRYSFWQNDYLKTFGQLGAGGTITGLVGRMVLGFEIMPWSDISFIVGVEGSNLMYWHQNKIFHSPKIGLNYGVAFNF